MSIYADKEHERIRRILKRREKTRHGKVVHPVQSLDDLPLDVIETQWPERR
jgi:hypothetical protein